MGRQVFIQPRQACFVSLLLDTHTFAWFFLADGRLPGAVRDLITGYEHDIFIGAISAHEMALKHRLGLWPEAGPLVEGFDALAGRARFKTLDITVGHAISAGQLSTVHRDPFDRIIAAQAIAERLRVVSKDRELMKLGAEVVWG